MPSLRLLRAFTHVAENRSFRAAADVLNITQPALSLQIKDLEERLGVRLFERQARAATLTRAGEALLPKARHILAASDELEQFAARLGEPLTGRLRLGVIPTIAPYLLPKLLQETAGDYPSLELHISEDKTENLLAALRNGQIDVALLALPLQQDDLHEQKLFDDAFVLAVPSAHELAKQKILSEADIMAGPLLLLDDGHCLRDQVLNFCKAPRTPGVKTGPANFRAASLRTLTELVAHGMGVTLLPAMAAKQEVQNHHAIKLRDLPMKSAVRTIGLAWRKNHPGAAEFKELAKTWARL